MPTPWPAEETHGPAPGTGPEPRPQAHRHPQTPPRVSASCTVSRFEMSLTTRSMGIVTRGRAAARALKGLLELALGNFSVADLGRCWQPLTLGSQSTAATGDVVGIAGHQQNLFTESRVEPRTLHCGGATAERTLVWRFLKKLALELPCDPGIPRYASGRTEKRYSDPSSPPAVTAAMFTVTKGWNQSE